MICTDQTEDSIEQKLQKNQQRVLRPRGCKNNHFPYGCCRLDPDQGPTGCIADGWRGSGGGWGDQGLPQPEGARTPRLTPSPFSASRLRCRSGWRPSRPVWRPLGCRGGLSWTSTLTGMRWAPGQLEQVGVAGTGPQGLPPARGPAHVQTRRHCGGSGAPQRRRT